MTWAFQPNFLEKSLIKKKGRQPTARVQIPVDALNFF